MFALGMRHMREREKKEREIAKKQEKARQIAELQRQQTGYRQISESDRQKLEQKEGVQRNASCPVEDRESVQEIDRRRSASDVILKFNESNANTIHREGSLDSNERKGQLTLPVGENGNRKNSDHLASIPEMSLPIGDDGEISPARHQAPRRASSKTPVHGSKSVEFRDETPPAADNKNSGHRAKNPIASFGSRFGSTKKKSAAESAPERKSRSGYRSLEHDSDHENSKDSTSAAKKRSSLKETRKTKFV